MADLSTYFSEKELRDRETGATLPDHMRGPEFHGFLTGLNDWRRELGRAIFVTSWYRSPGHSLEQKRKRGHKPPGTHSTGLAIDVRFRGPKELMEMMAALNKVATYNPSFHRLGIGINTQKGFIHIDTAGYLPAYKKIRPALWTY